MLSAGSLSQLTCIEQQIGLSNVLEVKVTWAGFANISPAGHERLYVITLVVY